MNKEIISNIIDIINKQIDMYYRFYGYEPKYLKINEELYSLLEWNSQQLLDIKLTNNDNIIQTFMGLQILKTHKKDIEVF